MKSILLSKVFFTLSLFIVVFITTTTSIAIHAEQIGVPENSIIVSQDNSAEDNENCGTNLTPDCRTIQHAVNRIVPGGVITVSPGTYNENILVDKTDIIINSFDGSSQTIINGSGATDETVSEAIRIIADGVTIGLENSTENGFMFRNSVASGLFSIGNNVTISGNAAENNGAHGFQFGLRTVDDGLIDNSSKDIEDDPLNGTTFISDNAGLQTQSNILVDNNTATNNTLGGFYFSAFDNSLVRNNSANSNRSTDDRRLGLGSGFWIDSGSNTVTLRWNGASNNAGDGIFYRRGDGAAPAGGLVTNQTAIANRVSSNGGHGIFFMGDDIVAQDNIAESNQRDGFHFMGYDTVSDISYNSLRNNSGAGLGFDEEFNGANALVLPIILDANGNHPVEFGGIHHNIITGNQSHFFPDDLDNTFERCGIATVLDNGTVIEMSHNFWGNNQEICDLSGNTVQQSDAAWGTNGLGSYGL